MSGVFDRLQKEIEDKQKDGGITPLDMVDLPPALRKIMRVMLRRVQMSYPDLMEAMKGVPYPPMSWRKRSRPWWNNPG
jgi:hypothetical protein